MHRASLLYAPLLREALDLKEESRLYDENARPPLWSTCSALFVKGNLLHYSPFTSRTDAQNPFSPQISPTETSPLTNGYVLAQKRSISVSCADPAQLHQETFNFLPEDQFDEEIGTKPPELTDLSALETILITKMFCHGTLFSIATDGSIAPPCIPLPANHDVAIAARSLPLSSNNLHKVFTIAGDLNADIIDMSPFRVRKSAIESAIACLIATNPCYANTHISQRKVKPLPNDGPAIYLNDFVLNAHISRQQPADIVSIDQLPFGECFPTIFPNGYGPFQHSTSFFLEEWALGVGPETFANVPTFRALLENATRASWRQFYWSTEEKNPP
ncbi:hypothetical protein Hypma_006972 [Hypsizygus marmoreus]|uniref:DUF6570 domain-containing protein n=1 Tax=Hypsizygus marmoreus TaxID=39966 RepID=A0A369JTM7_HYPMA|nr:hypothetical protein Hypma_006972 [Hypsizygus marmoreus]